MLQTPLLASPTVSLSCNRWRIRATRVSYGVRVLVRATSAAHWHDVVAALPPSTSPDANDPATLTYSIVWAEDLGTVDGKGEHQLYRDASLIFSSEDPAVLLWALQNDACWRVATDAKDVVFVHAGAVAYQGIGIILPGKSGMGKSTLVSQLLARGAAYYSDEYAVLGSHGQLRPYHCLLKLKDRPPGSQRIGPEVFGAPAVSEPIQIGVVAFPAFTRDTPFHIASMSSGVAALHLLEHMPAARSRPAEAMQAALRAARGAVCQSTKYNDSSQAAEYLVRMVEAQNPEGEKGQTL